MKTSCVFDTFIQSLPSVWPLPVTLEGGKYFNSTETQQRPKFSPKCMSDHPLVHYGQTLCEADFRKSPKNTLWKETY
jgi:hypothetical protein